MTSPETSPESPRLIDVGQPDAIRRIAVRVREGGQPGLFWLGGFKSDMQGTKAVALDAWAAERKRACVRFDYSGHGESGGNFVDGTIGQWLEESVAVFEQFCAGPQVAIGSSMGRTRPASRVRICENHRSSDLACSGSRRRFNSMPRRISARTMTLVPISSTGV